MPHELPKAYEPGAIEARWAEYWVREKLFHVETPAESGPAAADLLDGRGGSPLGLDGMTDPTLAARDAARMGHPRRTAPKPVFTLYFAPAASECNGAIAYGAHAEPDADGHHCALASHAG
jgi:hypothetical protein